MSSLFTNSFEDSSSSENGEGKENPSNDGSADPKKQKAEGNINVPLAQIGTVARLGSNNFQLPDLQPHEHSSLFYLSLIEARCRTQAANSLNAGRRPENKLTEDDVEVRELAQDLFSGMSKQLAKAGLLPSTSQNFARPEVAGLRAGYLNTFDNILNSIATKRAETAHKSSNSLAIDNSASAISTFQFSKTHALSTIPFTMADDQQVQKTPLLSPTTLAFFNSVTANGFQSEYVRDYRQLCLLGKGGFGQVFKVKSILDKQEYAIKKIPITRKRYENLPTPKILGEVQALAQYRHPNIVQYYHSWIELLPRSTTRRRAQTITSDDAFNMVGIRAITNQIDEERSPAGAASFQIEFGDSSSGVEQKKDNQRPHYIDSKPSKTTTKSTLETEEDSDDGEEGGVEGGSSNSQELSGPGWILCIKMALYPITLDKFLSTELPRTDELAIRHCFHTLPSLLILSSILNGIEYLHAEGMVHRDLKPANIFLTYQETIKPNTMVPGTYIDLSACQDKQCGKNGRMIGYITPCIGDFGLVVDMKNPEQEMSKLAIAGGSESKNSISPYPFASNLPTQAGTTLYCPPTPPQNDPICPKLDIYSLGVIAFELVCKFGSKSERIVALSGLKKGNLPGFLEQEVARGIRGMTCRDRDVRWGCEEVRGWLEGIMGDYE